ncbi:hypothetical protein TNCV_1396571 [Trichonephila clavipes]|nr:hypothetical protein TNCV_1396571 [Trichonephila clavipes]
MSCVGIPGNEKTDQNAKQEAESSQLEVPSTLRRANTLISKCIDKCTAATQRTKSHGKTLTPMGPIPRHLERAEAVTRFHLRPARSETIPEWRATICSNALESRNTRLTATSVGIERLGVKWSRS